MPAERARVDEPKETSMGAGSGYQLVREDCTWVVYPADVLLVRLELFSPVLIKAGWNVTSRTSLHCGFSGEAYMALYSECGRLVIESEDWSLAPSQSHHDMSAKSGSSQARVLNMEIV